MRLPIANEFSSFFSQMYVNCSYCYLEMVMTKMERVPAPQQQSRDGSGSPSSPKSPLAGLLWLLERRSLLSRLRLKLPSQIRSMPSQYLRATLQLQKSRKDPCHQGTGGFQKRANRPKPNPNPPLFLLIVQNYQSLLRLRTC